VPKASPIRDSGNENATQKSRFGPEKSVFSSWFHDRQAIFALFSPAASVFPAKIAGCDTMQGTVFFE
jgi:hypothetical protein